MKELTPEQLTLLRSALLAAQKEASRMSFHFKVLTNNEPVSLRLLRANNWQSGEALPTDIQALREERDFWRRVSRALEKRWRLHGDPRFHML